MRSKILAGLLAVLTVALLVAANGSGRNFKADLSGENEVEEPVDTDTTGRASFHANGAETEIDFKLQIKNAEGILGVAGAHIHCGGPDENGPIIVFLAGAVPGGFDGKVDISATFTEDAIDTSTECGDTIPELLDDMQNGDTYVNVHSIDNPGGEIRGQIG